MNGTVPSMQFALVNGERSRPKKGLRGHCQYCDGEMVAKCGPYIVWHWAHMPGSNCDPWWGPESEWHRGWKNLFPEDWQEIVHFDERTGEKHIADVKTPHGLVIEFQNSPMSFEELASREAFYQEMIWIVNGDGGSLNPNYFNLGLMWEGAISFRPLVRYVKWMSRNRLLHKWSAATTPVYIDFGFQGMWRFFDFRLEDDVGAFSPLDQNWLIEACLLGESIPIAYVSEEDEEEYISRLRSNHLDENDDMSQ